MYNFANNQYKLVGYVLSKENILSDNNYVILVTEDGSLLWFNDMIHLMLIIKELNL